MLAVAAFAAELSGDLADLSYTGGADGVPHGEQPTGGADRDAAADVELPGLEVATSVAGRADADGFDVEELFDGEGVVEFDDIEVGGRYTGLTERLGDGLPGEGGVEVLAVIDGL
jgi:hypothetical protein